jgi:acyl-CoA synthetase (NDP forming)
VSEGPAVDPGAPGGTADLRALFAPRRVAVLGASRDPGKLGHRVVRNLLEAGFPGEVIPVNPSGAAILGRASAARVEDLPEALDLALVSLPAGAVPAAVRALAGRRCRFCVVLASGFGETGATGRAIEAQLGAVARRTGMRIVGPNCMGVVDVPGRVNASYFWDVPRQPGGITFVSQSGAYGGLFFREARERGLGIAKFLSIGNQADLGFTECLAWLADDAETRAVGVFVEAIRDGRAFVAAARRLARRKPVVALKGGRAAAGRRAAGSHTGSIAGGWAAYRAAFAAAGVVAVDETEELFDALQALEAHAGRPPRDEAVAILTISGGPSVVAADTAEAVGLRVPALPEPRRAALRAHLPGFAADGNPVDMTPQIDPGAFAPSVRLVLDAPEIAGAIAIDVGLDRPEYAAALVAAQAGSGKPVVACTLDTPEMDRVLRAAGIPILAAPERAVRAYRALVRRAALRRRVDAGPDPRPAGSGGGTADALSGPGVPLPHAAARELLARAGVPFAREVDARSLDEALSAAEQIGYPLVVKTARADVLHRTEVGGVVAGIGDRAALRRAVAGLTARLGPGPVLVQEQVPPGLELLVGGRRDASFGPLVAVGLGGVLAEILGEVVLELAPVTPEAARAMLAEGRLAALLRGFRGAAPVDAAALGGILVGLGELLVARPEIVELDVNPLIASGDRLVAVDALILVSPETVETGRTSDAT